MRVPGEQAARTSVTQINARPDADTETEQYLNIDSTASAWSVISPLLPSVLVVGV
jgi:hypothetical protein